MVLPNVYNPVERNIIFILFVMGIFFTICIMVYTKEHCISIIKSLLEIYPDGRIPVAKSSQKQHQQFMKQCRKYNLLI